MTMYTTPNLANAGAISAILDELEKNISKLTLNMGTSPMLILEQMDQAQAKITDLQAKEQNIQREAERFAELGEMLRKDARIFLKLIGSENLKTARARLNPPSESWWWYLDQWQIDQTKRSIRRSLIRGGIIVSILTVLVILYQVFLAPDPATRAMYDHQFRASQALQAEIPDFAAALVEVTAALQYAPDDLDMVCLKGVLEEKLGQPENAEKSWQTAQSIAPNQEQYLLALTSAYLQVYEYQKGIDYAQQVIALNPDSAEGYFYLGQAYYSNNDKVEAYQTYQIAAEKAEKANKIEMVALIRVRMAYLTQELGVLSGD